MGHYNPLIGLKKRNRIIRAHRTSKGVSVVFMLGGKTVFLEHSDPRFVRLIGYLGIKEGESAWVQLNKIEHVLEILAVTTCDKGEDHE
ncbi:hypothetical protein D3C87_1230760 [compost metagenome]